MQIRFDIEFSRGNKKEILGELFLWKCLGTNGRVSNEPYLADDLSMPRAGYSLSYSPNTVRYISIKCR